MNSIINRKTNFADLGLMDYTRAWEYQASLFENILDIKKTNRNLPAGEQIATENFLLFCEHPHVYTLGKSGDENNLKIRKEDLHSIDATYHHTNRGGDITYHGPGQIVGYPILDLENFFTDIHKYMRLLEESVMLTLNEYGIVAGRIAGLTGVWLDVEDAHKARKICALGVKSSRWVTMHGLAFNVTTDLRYFDHIIPCGIKDKAVTSLEKELGFRPDIQEVKRILKQNIVRLFDMEEA